MSAWEDKYFMVSYFTLHHAEAQLHVTVIDWSVAEMKLTHLRLT